MNRVSIQALDAEEPRISKKEVVLALALILSLVTAWRLWVGPTVGGDANSATVPAVPRLPIGLETLPIQGSSTAALGIVVFSDFECPFCRRFALEVLPYLRKEYVHSGRVLLAFSDFPLPSHATAAERAAMAECAGRQGRFWEVHDRLFLQAPNSPAMLAGANLVDSGMLASCMAVEGPQAIRGRRTTAMALGINATPTLLIGVVRRGETHMQMQATDILVGFHSAKELSRILERRLAGAAGQSF